MTDMMKGYLYDIGVNAAVICHSHGLFAGRYHGWWILVLIRWLARDLGQNGYNTGRMG